jgi:tetratricopeptide (TPR) repeat protein
LASTPATHQPHRFEDLSPDDFERLVYWLVKRSGEFDEVQWYGGARDKGRDVVAFRHAPARREKWYIQCKRYQSISFPTLRDELDKLAQHAKGEPTFAPDVIVFATACPVPPQARDEAAVYARTLGLPAPYYWGRVELDERLKAQPKTENEFFGLPFQETHPAYTPPTPPTPGELPEPGPLPPGSRIPFPRNVLFTGRTEPLKALARTLLHDGATSTLVTQAVSGMGGVGKTQLTVEFAYRYGRFFCGVHWLNAAQPAALSAEVAACGEAMCLPYWPDKQPEQVARTLDEWRRGGPRLVILDNLEDVDAAQEWLARLGGGPVRVLVTARRSDWPAHLGLEPLKLEVFTPDESCAFLRRYLPEEQATEPDLDLLAERLGHLPLALELAGRYLASTPHLTVAAYLARLEDVWNHPSMAGWRKDLGSPTGHDLSLAQTFAVGWVRVEDETARRLFLLAGHCAPNQPIPCQMLEQAAGLDEEGCDGALGILTSLGLLEMEDREKGPVIHPLLAEFARKLPKAPASLPALADALAALTHWALETGLPARFAPLRPHMELVAPAAEKAGLKDAGALWNNLSSHLHEVADYTGAQAAFERALAIDEQCHGSNHPEVAININNLGLVLRDLGDLARARAAFERALAIWRAVYGDEHPQVATAHNNLGLVLKDQGNLAGAQAAHERALAIDERVYGPDHPTVATVVNNLGSVLRALGDLTEARAAFEHALAIDEHAYGLDHPNVARDVDNLGRVLKDLGDLAGARATFERALAIDERAFGPDHPNVATHVNNLGSVLRALEDLAGARAAFERALAIDERVFGPDHPNVAAVVNNLGMVLRDLGDPAGAQAAFGRALSILEKFLPPEHPDIRIVRRNLEVVDRGTRRQGDREREHSRRG